MFWALNGATRTPWRASQRQIPAVTTLLPASEVVPATSRPAAHAPASADRRDGDAQHACGERTSRESRAARRTSARGRVGPVAVPGARGRPVGVDGRTAEPHPQRAGEGGLAGARVGTRDGGRVATPDAARLRPASRRLRGASSTVRAAVSRAGSKPARSSSRAAGIAEPLIALAVVADHRVEGVDDPVGDDPGRARPRRPRTAGRPRHQRCSRRRTRWLRGPCLHRRAGWGRVRQGAGCARGRRRGRRQLAGRQAGPPRDDRLRPPTAAQVSAAVSAVATQKPRIRRSATKAARGQRDG